MYISSTKIDQNFEIFRERESESFQQCPHRTASAGSNGSISPQGGVAVNYGGSQTFTITPNQYYRVADVKVDGVSKGPITSYTFNNVTSNHSIRATFVRKGSRWW